MKRALSFLLCLIMCFSFYSGTAPEAFAVDGVDGTFIVREGVVRDGKITYTVTLAGGTTDFGGAVILAEYDNTTLKPIGFAASGTGATSKNFKGLFVGGDSADYENVYSVAYTNNAAESKTSNTEFFSITFEVINDERPPAYVNFYCKEYYCVTDPEQTFVGAGDLESLPVIRKFADVVTIETPKTVAATLFTGGIRFSWEATTGAVAYQIRRISDISGWEVIATVSGDVLQYDDFIDLESGMTYTYNVRAVNAGGSMSVPTSSGVSCKYVSKPTNVVAINGVNGIDVAWDACPGADSYSIMRREYGETEWFVLAVYPATKPTTVYKDTEVEIGKTYEYDVNSNLGSFMTDSSEYGCTVTHLPTPGEVVVENTAEGIELNWSFIEGARYYNVHRTALEDGSIQNVITVSNSYVDKDVELGKAYTYTIQAVNDNSASSYTKGNTIVRVPSTVVTEVTPDADYITVSWKSVENIDGYHIYRRARGGSWVKAGSVDKDTLTFNDTLAPSGKSYYYCVTPFIGASESQKVSTKTYKYFLKAPQNVTAVNTKDGIKVTWEKSAGSTEYYVFRKVGSSSFSLVESIDADKSSFVDKSVKEGKVYRYYVQALSEKGESKQSKNSSSTMRICAVKITKGTILSNGIQLSWNDKELVDYYIVYRKNGKNWEKIAKTSKNKYTDKNVVSGKTYEYKVVAVVDSYKSGIDDSTAKKITFVSAPVITKTANSSDSTTVKWSGVKGAEKYQLYRVSVDSKGKAKGSYKRIATVSSSKKSYEDKGVKAGTTYKYKVYAVAGSGKSVASSEYKTTFLAVPKIKSVTSEYKGAKITWAASKGASKYRVYRKDANGNWKLLGKVSGSTRAYTDKTVKNGEKIYYCVRAENGSSISYYKAKSITFLASPKAQVSNVSEGIKVTWEKVDGASSYYIYRKESGSKTWKKVSTVTKTSYTDKNVKAGTTYKYSVRAYNGKALSGYNTSGWSVKRLVGPKLKSIKNSAKGVTVTWEKSKGATSYEIYRKDDKRFATWEKIGTSKTTSYTDKKAASGGKYVYTVKAVSGSSVSVYSTGSLAIERLSTPILKTAQSTRSGARITWSEVPGSSGYLIYRKTGSGKYKEIAKIRRRSTTSYTDRNVEKGKTYTYTVCAYSTTYTSSYDKTGLKVKVK